MAKRDMTLTRATILAIEVLEEKIQKLSFDANVARFYGGSQSQRNALDKTEELRIVKETLLRASRRAKHEDQFPLNYEKSP